jgi:phosphoesterase RecJ-like protein
MGLLPSLTLPAAEAIYTGMMTDTNNFLNNCNRPDTFRTVANMLEYGIAKDRLYESVYNNYAEQRMRLLGYALNEKMVVLPEYRTAYIALSRAELDRFNFQAGDTEGFVNYPLSIKDVVLSCFLSENPENIRLSFRSLGSFSVNDFSRIHFEGGGHLNAAGGTSILSLDETVDKLVQSLALYKDELAAV